ncbi:MAG: glycosyltransferase family 4 protein [Thermodesulfobacteriota bacterium]
MTLKILHYVDENNLTWARPWLQLIKYLEDKGLQNHILCRPGGSLDKHVIENNIGLSTYKPLISSLPHLCPGVSAIIKEIRPDIIHTRLSSAAMIGGYWGKRMGVPVVSTIDKYPKKKYYKQSTKLIPCSNAIATHMRKQGFSDSGMQVIFNPVNVDEYRRDLQKRKHFRDTNGIQETDFVILGAGRFVDWKGFDTLLEACSLLESKLASVQNWKIWLAGDGPERQNLESYVKSSPNLGSKVRFWGFVDDIRPLMWASDLFVLPSHNEPFGLVLLEAMACGLPVITTSSGGPLDIVSKDTGWLFKAGDVHALAKRLTKVLQIDDLSYYSEMAKVKADNFSVEKIGEQTLRFYETVIDS